MTQDLFDLNFLTKYSLEKRFATLLSETRKQQGVTLEQLSEGLCTESQLAKIEKAERLPARTLQKRLLERLGFELAGFENFLQAEEYEDWKEKEQILYYIEADELKTAKKLLKQYAKKQGLENKQDADILNLQFYLVMQAQIAEHEMCSEKLLPQEREKIEAKLCSYYETAVQLTVQNFFWGTSYNLKKNGAFYLLNEIEGVQEYLDACFSYVKEVAINEDGEVWMISVALAILGLVYNKEYCEEQGVDFTQICFPNLTFFNQIE